AVHGGDVLSLEDAGAGELAGEELPRIVARIVVVSPSSVSRARMVHINSEEVEQIAILLRRALAGEAIGAYTPLVYRVIGDLHQLEVGAGIERVLRLPKISVPNSLVWLAASLTAGIA